MIQFFNVDFGYGANAFALRNINFTVASGERVCLLGRNGSGKSTLLKLAAGISKPSSGDVTVAGISTHNESALNKQRASLGFIFQNPEDQLLTTSVQAELAFTLENLNIEPKEIAIRIAEFAGRFGLSELLQRHPSQLSAGEKQRLALAATLISNPQVLILDEPTSYLDEDGRAFVCETIFSSREWCILAATQDIVELERYDRIVFVESGEIAFDGTVVEFKTTAIFAEIVKFESPGSPRQIIRVDGVPAVELRNVEFRYPDSEDDLPRRNLSFKSGIVTTIFGPSGSGKTTLGLLIAGLWESSEGEILVNGIACSADERLSKVGVVFQIPESAIFAETVFDEIAFGLRNQKVAEESIAERVRTALESVGLAPDRFLARNPFTLSAGEQRLVAIASIVALDREIMIFDESTAGLDWQGRARVRDLILRLHEEGRGIIVITHNNMFAGQISYTFVILTGDND